MAEKRRSGNPVNRMALVAGLMAGGLLLCTAATHVSPDASEPVDPNAPRYDLAPNPAPSKRDVGFMGEPERLLRSARGAADDRSGELGEPYAGRETWRDRPLNEGRTFKKNVLAEGLISPDGVAIHPLTGRIYVSEEDAGRISMLDNGSSRVVIDRWTPIIHEGDYGRQRGDPLTFPEAIVFCEQGHLYVAEDVPDGRLILFRADAQGDYWEGVNIDIPGSWPGFAWEGLDVSRRNEIVLAGSNLEWATRQDVPIPFESVMLYRDPEARWWVISREPFTSYSESRFSKSGEQVIYTCEVTGAIGWIHLIHRRLRGYSSYSGRSPEGVTVLPDGSFLVAEEASGSIVHICPATDRYEHVVTGLRDIESVLWDPAHHRILVTEDGTGRLLAFEVDKPYDGGMDLFDHAMYSPGRSPRIVPDSCPQYLARILAFGGLDYRNGHPPISFHEFVSRVPMIAADMRVEPIHPDKEIEDPVERVQFVVFDPNRLMRESGRLELAFAIFGLQKQSGQIVRTSRMPVAVKGVRLPGHILRDMGSGALVVPQPAAVHLSGAGTVSVHFLGLGRTPDYSLVLNPSHPNNSYMVVHNDDGTLDQYRMIHPGPEGADNWVVTYSRISEEDWTRLDSAEN